MENPFGQLKMELEIPLRFQIGQKFPPETDSKDLEFSEKTTKALEALRDSFLEDLANVK